MGIFVNRGIEQAIAIAGSQRALGKLIDKTQASISVYLYGKPPPIIALEIQKQVGVSAKLIRPDIFGEDEAGFIDD